MAKKEQVAYPNEFVQAFYSTVKGQQRTFFKAIAEIHKQPAPSQPESSPAQMPG